MRFTRNISFVAVTVVLAGLVGALDTPAGAATATLVSEAFTGSSTTSSNWVLPATASGSTNGACLSGATATTGSIGACTTPGSQPGLQLTNSDTVQVGGLGYGSSVPSSLGLDVRFDSYQYGGTGADGLAFFLAASDPNNAAASPVTLGAFGGSLGYAYDKVFAPSPVSGLSHGYLGVGLDVFGNFSNLTTDPTCNDASPSGGRNPESITIRGPGNGTAGYCALDFTGNDGVFDSATPQAVPVEVAINPTGADRVTDSGLTVPAHSYLVWADPLNADAPMQETGPLPDATAYVPDSSWVDSRGVPQQLTFGWSASTGDSTDFHTIANASVKTLNGTPPRLTVGLTSDNAAPSNGQTIHYTASPVVNDSDESRTITLTDTFPAGLVPTTTGLGATGWTCTVNGQTVTCTHAPAAVGALTPVVLPAVVTLPSGAASVSLTNTVTVGSPDATQGSTSTTQVFATVPYTDASAVAQNTSWTTAALLTTAGANGVLAQPGEARWFKFPVTPSSQVQVDLTNLAQNYDLTMYSDIGAAFTTLTTTTDLNVLGAEQTGSAYSPSIYSPSIYSPSIYSPSIYSPSIYSPSIYSPSIYSPSIYSPSIYSPSIYSPSIYSPSIYSPSIYSPSIYSPSTAFLQAFSDAQARSLIGVSAQDGTAPESISAATWSNTGYFYVRVAGRNGASSPTAPFRLDLAVTGGPCTGITLNSYANDATLTGTPGAANAVIVTDGSRLSLTTSGVSTDLTQLAAATGGVVIDVSKSPRVVDLNKQADANASCAYAKNLVAQAIRDIINSYRDANGTLKYVALIGGDSVLPYFRYADTSGLGSENGYVPPVLGTSASQASLQSNDVLGQDAYGAVSDLTLKASVLPVPDLAVGRLVETPAEIDGQIKQFLGLSNQTLPTPKSSLVTGYDFLTSAADKVETDLAAGLGAGARNDQLITNQGVPTTTVTGAAGPTRTTSWTATDLSNSLFNSHHDVVFLAGHFSANSTLAADYSTSLLTTDLAAHPGTFTNTLVFSAGCHSGYNLVDGDAVPGLTQTLDWAQAVAQQKGILIGGTGYQYADTNFLAYSAKIYTMFASELRAGTTGTAISIGQALVKAKQDYLDTLSTIGGIDQKAILESAMYGLPMTAINLPGARTGVPATPAGLITTPVAAGTPGGTLGLRTTSLNVTTTTTPHTSPVLGLTGTATGANYTWLTGPDGSVNQPAVPTLPEQIVPATSTTGESLRGVGFRSGTYSDTSGITPLTGAPTTEQNGIHTTFSSSAFFPQNLYSVNYFDAIGGSNSGGQTRVILTPAQYRSDAAPATTDTARTYSNVGLNLFYSANTTTYGQNTPALAQAPSISQVTSTASADGRSVTVAAHITGDPSAGIQQVWVTYTGETGALHGTWASVDLVQNATDSTLWTGTVALPTGQTASDLRFIVQAVNGVGLVGLDNNLGAYYTPGVAVGVISPTATATSLKLDAPATSVTYGGSLAVGATLTGAPTGSVVAFDLGGQGTVTALTNSAGRATATVPVIANPGTYPVNASYAGSATLLASSARSTAVTVTKASTTLVLSTTRSTIASASAPKLPALRVTSTGAVASNTSTLLCPIINVDLGIRVTLTGGALNAPLPQRSVLFTLKGLLFGQTITASRTTDGQGIATLGAVALVPDVYTISASFGSAQAGISTDPVFAASSAPGQPVIVLPGLPIYIAPPAKK